MVAFTGWLSSDALSHTNLNTHQQEYEDAINNIIDGGGELTSPTIGSFVNSTHDHSDAANGGQISASGVSSGAAADGQVLTADGGGGSAWEAPTTSFANLTDTPSGYAAKKWNIPRVNNGETALVYVEPAFCQVQRTTTQNIPNNTTTPINFSGLDVVDPLGMHNPASNNERILIPQTGMYLVSASILWAIATANGSARLEIWHADASAGLTFRVRLEGGSVSTASTMPASITGQVWVDDVNDWIEIRVYQNSTAPLNLQPTSSPDFYSIRAEVSLLWAHSGVGT